MKFTKKFVAVLMALTQVTLSMPHSQETLPQPTNTPRYPIPQINPQDPNYEKYKELHERLKKESESTHDTPAPAPSEQPESSPAPETPEEPAKEESPKEEPPKEEPPKEEPAKEESPKEEPPKEEPKPQSENPETTNSPGSNPQFNPQKVLDETNEIRAKNGKTPLKLHSALSQEAYNQSKYQKSVNELTHDRPGSGIGENLKKLGINPGNVAENVVAGALTDHDVVNSFAGSKDHLANMLGDYNYMGAAIEGGFASQVFSSSV